MKALIIMLLIMPEALLAMTDIEVVKLIEASIDNHASTTVQFLMAVSAISSILLGWLFYLINANRKAINFAEESRHRDQKEVMDKLDKYKEKLEKHTLHVANHYIRDEKVEKLLEHAVKPLQDQITALQKLITEHFNHSAIRNRQD